MATEPCNGRSQPNGRRTFLWMLATAPIAWALGSMLQRMRARNESAPVLIPPEVPVGLTVVGEVIVNRGADGTVRAFSASCTHLGCRLDRIVDGVIVCPCHGSRFEGNGRVVSGPAVRPLTMLHVSLDASTGGWTAHAD